MALCGRVGRTALVSRPVLQSVTLAVFLVGSLTLRAERLPLKAYTSADGLPNDEVDRIVADSRGFVWFCTKDGLARFDGYSFTNFSAQQGLPEGSVNDLLETRSGDYWVGTDDGLMHFDPKGRPSRGIVEERHGTGAKPMFARVASTTPDADRFAKTITVLRQSHDGTVWVGTRKGLYRLENTAEAHFLRSVDIGLPRDAIGQREIADIREDRFGALWIVAPSGLYRRWSDGTTASYGAREGVPGTEFSAIYEDREGRFWVSSRESGFFGFTADATHSPPKFGRAFSVRDGLPNVWVNQLLETSDGRFWVADAQGLLEFFPTGDAHGVHFHVYGQRNGLTHYFIHSLDEDLAGNLWLGVSNAGAMKLARDGFTTYGRLDGISNVNAIFEDRAGEVCFRGYVLGDRLGTVFEGRTLDLLGPDPMLFTRLGCFDGQRFDWFEPAAVTRWGWVLEGTTLQARNGEFWLGTEQGVFRFAAADRLIDIKHARPRAVYRMSDDDPSTQVARLFEDSSGNIWIATTSSTTNGLARWESQSERVVDLAQAPGLPPLKNTAIFSFGEDASGNIWTGFSSGLARYSHGTFRWFGAAEGLPAGTIRDIHLDRAGRLWLGSERAGLIRVDGVNADRPAFVSFTMAQGLSSDFVQTIVEDSGGFLYVGSGQGIDRFDSSTGHVRHFTATDGLTPGLLRAGFRDRRGALWFGTTTGLVRFIPGDDVGPDSPGSHGPRTLISAVRVAGVPQLVSALGEVSVVLPDLPSDHNQVEAEFFAFGWTAGEVLRYQYRLVGATATWSAPSLLRSVNFASLARGRYTLLVRAVNSDGTVSDAPASLSFTILGPIWTRWWFIALVVASVAAILFALYRYRMARVLELAAIRTRIATDLHDDIGANLTRIGLLSEVARQDRDDDRLTSIGNIARESVSAMSDIVWTINPRHESLADVIGRMRRHGEDLFTQRDIDLRFNAPDAHDSLRLSMDVRRDLLLIFKEAVNNTARHAHCTRVSIDLYRRGSRLIFSITDNGVGFDTSSEYSGQGLTSLRRRTERLKGTIDVQSVPGAGTTLTLQIPI